MSLPNLSPEVDRENHRQLRRLVLSIRASAQQLNLLIAICDNRSYRDELIRAYTEELTDLGIACHVARLQLNQPSLKACLQQLVAAEPHLATGENPTLVTVLGADELLGIRLQQSQSAQSQFFFSVQWTREGLRQFRFPVVLWVTPAIATALAQQAPDFWSWRGGVFEFSRPAVLAQQSQQRTASLPSQQADEEEEEENAASPQANPEEIAAHITALTAQAPDSPLLPSLYRSLGRAYKNALHYAEAETVYRQALTLYQHHLGDHHLETATNLNDLAELYGAMGRYGEAESLCTRALEIRRAELGDRHPSTAQSLNNLATLYRAMGRAGEAESLYTEALEISRSKLGDRHPDTAISLNNLAELYRAMGRAGEAESLYTEALEIRRVELGDRHPSTAQSLNNLAELYRAMGRYCEAEPLFTEALEIWKTELGDRHPDTATSLNNLAVLYYVTNRFSEAAAMMSDAISIRAEVLGPDHPYTIGSRKRLAAIQQAMQEG